MNIWLFFFVIGVGSLGIFATILYTENYVLPFITAITISFYSRFAQHLTPHTTLWHDGFFYYSIYQSIIETGRIQVSADVLNWYPQATMQLPWFGMQANSVFLSHTLGITEPSLVRNLFSSILGPLLFIILVALYKELLNFQWGFIAAYLTVLLDVVIFYQSHYHAQGFAILLVALVLLALVYVDLRKKSKRFIARRLTRKYILLCIFIIGLSLSHHFTSFLISSLLVLFILEIYTMIKISGFSSLFVPFPMFKSKSLKVFFTENMRGYSIATFLLLLSSSILVMMSSDILVNLISSRVEGLINNLDNFQQFLDQSLSSQSTLARNQRGSSTIIDSFSGFLKLGYGILGIGGVLVTLNTKKRPKWAIFFYLLFASLLTAFVILGVFPKNFPRIILVGYLLLIPFSINSISILVDKLNANKTIILFLTICVVMSTAAGVNTSVIDPNSDIKADGFHRVDPHGIQAVEAGFWMKTHMQMSKDIYVSQPTRMIPIYYGEKLNYNTRYFGSSQDLDGYGVYDIQYRSPPKDSCKIYSNGRIIIVSMEDEC